MVLRCFSAPDEKVNLCFYPCSCGTGPGDHDTYCQESLCIYDTDYTKLLLSYLESEFPEFDVCWDNRIPAGTWNIIIQKIENDMSHIHFDDTVFDFYSRFISWIADALEQEDMIIVKGKPVKPPTSPIESNVFCQASALSAATSA